MARSKSNLFSIRAPLPKRTAFLLGFVAPALVLGVWCLLTYGNFVKPDFLPSPTEVVRGTLQLFMAHSLDVMIKLGFRKGIHVFLEA